MHCNMKLKIGWAILGITAGIMAGGVFIAQYKNYSAGLMAFFSSLCATELLYLHIAYSKKWFHQWTPSKISAFIVISKLIFI